MIRGDRKGARALGGALCVLLGLAALCLRAAPALAQVPAGCPVALGNADLVGHDLSVSFCELCDVGTVRIVIENPFGPGDGVGDFSELVITEDLMASGLSYVPGSTTFSGTNLPFVPAPVAPAPEPTTDPPPAPNPDPTPTPDPTPDPPAAFGTIAGPCGLVAPQLDDATGSLLRNRFDFDDDPYDDPADRPRLTSGAQTIARSPNAGRTCAPWRSCRRRCSGRYWPRCGSGGASACAASPP